MCLQRSATRPDILPETTNRRVVALLLKPLFSGADFFIKII